MVCKLEHISDFFQKYPQLIDGIDEEGLKELFETFPHACKFVKELEVDSVNCEDLEVVSQKTLELLDGSFEHEYTKEYIIGFAGAICKVFDIVGAPRYHVPFILVMLSKL